MGKSSTAPSRPGEGKGPAMHQDMTTTNDTMGLIERVRLTPYQAASSATVAYVGFCAAHPAFAATDPNTILSGIQNLLKTGLTFVGGAMVVFGGVTIGINVHNGASGNGAAIASGVATMVGGAIVAAAAVYFGDLGTIR